MSALTPERASTTARPVLRSVDDCPSLLLLPVPVGEPPYDDEPVVGRHLHAVAPAEVRAPVGPLRDLVPLRLVPPPVQPAALPRPGLPPVRPVAHALVQGLLEVLAGVRPVIQLRRRASVELYDALEERVHALPRATGDRPLPGAIRFLHVQQLTGGVAEVCATVRRDRRAAALALRLEHRDGSWCCTAIDGLPGGDLPG
jgi:hypothetical protein